MSFETDECFRVYDFSAWFMVSSILIFEYKNNCDFYFDDILITYNLNFITPTLNLFILDSKRGCIFDLPDIF